MKTLRQFTVGRRSRRTLARVVHPHNHPQSHPNTPQTYRKRTKTLPWQGRSCASIVLQCSVWLFRGASCVAYCFFGSTSLPQVRLRFFILWCSVRLTYMRPGCVVARALNSSNGNSHSWFETVRVCCPLDLLVRNRCKFSLFGFSGVFSNVDFRIRWFFSDGFDASFVFWIVYVYGRSSFSFCCNWLHFL